MAQRNNEKRNQILSVAYECFSRMPYAQVSLANIAEGAEINKSLLQHYYARKNDIIKALLDELLADVRRGIEPLEFRVRQGRKFRVRQGRKGLAVVKAVIGFAIRSIHIGDD